ncbi:NUDIX hydrolase [Nocardioides conyzicola]|uniref:Nudix hydrolase domain-containing protein n=1 Tax=Nocardioides conyzicola TaxID=1651781 RepID=A0ABP8XR18_9ACTN
MRIPRTTARVLPVSADGAVLLLQEQDPARPGVTWWGTVGGAVDPGETLPEAAVREMREEIGLVVTTERLIGPIGTGIHEFSFAGVDYVSQTNFFAMALERDVEVSFEHLEPEEVGNVLAASWWFPEDLEVDGTAAQDDLPDVMRRAVAAVRGTA